MDTSIAAQFHEQGCAHPIRVMPEDVGLEFGRRLQRDLAALSGETGFDDWTYYKPYLIFDWYFDLACDDTLLDAVEQLVGPNILLWGGSIVVKEPRTKGYFSWHQDEEYWNLEPKGKAVVAWLALGEVNAGNGCMRYIPGSHREGSFLHELTYHPDNYLRRGQRLINDPDLDEAVDIELHPGEMSLHHGLVVHGSGANESDQPRLGITMTFIPADVKAIGADESAVLVRGEDAHHYFRTEQRPRGLAMPEDREIHRAAMEEITARTISRAGKQQAFSESAR